jgi:DNA-binding protein HU-beta
MNKAELIDALAAEAQMTKADARKALDAFMNVVGEALTKDDKIALVGFGTFSTVFKEERIGRNPKDGSEIKIPAKKIVKFKAGADLAGKVK